MLSNAYFFVSRSAVNHANVDSRFWAISVNRTKGPGGRGAPEKLRITKTQAAKSKPAKLKLRFRDMPAYCTKIKRENTSRWKPRRQG